MFIWITEFVFLALFTVVVVTQIIIPSYKGTSLFPCVRNKDKLNEIKEIHDKLEERDLLKERDRLNKKLNK